MSEKSKCSNRSFYSGVIVLALLCAAASGADGPLRESAVDSMVSADYDPGVIVVSARREKQLTTVDEVTRDQFGERCATTVAQALENVPGSTICTGNKNEASIMIRGIRPERVLVLLDGRPLNMPYYGRVDLNTIALDNVERITVSRGAPSLLYGVNGSAGVVNIITTRHATPDSYDLSGTAAIGELNSLGGGVRAGLRIDNLDFGTSFSNYRSSGYPLPSEYHNVTGIEDGGKRDNSDFDRQNFTAGAGYNFSSENSVAISGGFYNDEKGIPSPTDFAQYRRFVNWRRWYIDASGRCVLPANHTVRAKIFYDDFANQMIEYSDKTLQSSNWNSYHAHWDAGGSLHYTVPIGTNDCTVGINGKHEEASTEGYMNESYRAYEMNTGSIALEGSWAGKIMPLRLNGGGGISLMQPAGNGLEGAPLSGTFDVMGGGSWTFQKIVAHLSAGVYTRYPALYQIFGDSSNVNLQPERSLNTELGLTSRPGYGLTLRCTGFAEEFLRLIEPQRTISGRTYYTNISKAFSRGIENSCALDLERIKSGFSADYVLNCTYNNDLHSAIAFVPCNKIGAGCYSGIIPGCKIRLWGEWNGERAGDANGVFYKGYYLLNGSISCSWKTLIIRGVVNNILDEVYATEGPYYPMPGRTLRLTCAASLKGRVIPEIK